MQALLSLPGHSESERSMRKEQKVVVRTLSKKKSPVLFEDKNLHVCDCIGKRKCDSRLFGILRI